MDILLFILIVSFPKARRAIVKMDEGNKSLLLFYYYYYYYYYYYQCYCLGLPETAFHK